ncbi:hypothetical protein [Clostridium omnivorum]|uniref:Uncharacterized protein n=1 Tax=Clostridium omnivorum TaxID=1604902 RepID=A0ABQ5NCB2_9CLOT|nr:hypothetical protein [Clostridium sp. E14]GLC32909.1 hypothetical protein bsdE14_43190 [Clostridium sp. E14]
MGLFNKMLRQANKANKVMKDVEMVGNFVAGDKKKATRRAKNKIKGKIANKVFKSLKF